MNHVGFKLMATAALAATLFPVVGSAASMLDDMMKTTPAYSKLPRIKHTPEFRIEAFSRPKEQEAEGTDWWWIYDGPQKIGMVQTWTKEIEMFRFTKTPDGEIVDYTIPAIHHFGTLVGAKINIYAPEFSAQHEPIVLTWVKREGPELQLKTVDRMKNGAEGENIFRLAWDEKLGYVWHCENRYRLKRPGNLEFNNLLAGGVSDSRAKQIRFQKVLRGVEPGKMAWFWLNPPNTPGGPLAGNGFIAFVRDAEMNPCVALDEVSAPVHLATCSQWYDQHIIATAPKEPAADGLHHIIARYQFLSIPSEVSAALEEKAESVNKGTDGGRGPGFLAGVTNDFETPVPGDRLYIGPIWRQPYFWDRTSGHSGSSSLRITGQGPDKRTWAGPVGGGTGIYGESGKRYRLSGWVKSNLEDGEAYIEADDCFWHWEDMRATRRTKGVSGKTDWTELSVEFQPGPNNPFLLIKLCVDGTGAAWFDDLALMEIPED